MISPPPAVPWRVALISSEPTLQLGLKVWVGSREDMTLIPLVPDDPPDLLLAAPPDATSLGKLQQQYPDARIVAFVDWKARATYEKECPGVVVFDCFQPLDDLFQALKMSLQVCPLEQSRFVVPSGPAEACPSG